MGILLHVVAAIRLSLCVYRGSQRPARPPALPSAGRPRRALRSSCRRCHPCLWLLLLSRGVMGCPALRSAGTARCANCWQQRSVVRRARDMERPEMVAVAPFRTVRRPVQGLSRLSFRPALRRPACSTSRRTTTCGARSAARSRHDGGGKVAIANGPGCDPSVDPTEPSKTLSNQRHAPRPLKLNSTAMHQFRHRGGARFLCHRRQAVRRGANRLGRRRGSHGGLADRGHRLAHQGARWRRAPGLRARRMNGR